MTTVENRDKNIKELKSLHYSGEPYSSGQMGGCNRPNIVQKSHMERDPKRSRREIANSNERKRMKSINCGFQQLKSQLPLSEDDRLSKSSVLQQAVNHIQKLEHERKHLRQQNTRLVHRLIELKKSICGSSCSCKGKCCPVDTGSQTVRERLLDSDLTELTDTSSDREQDARSVNDLNKRLYDVQALLDAERKKTSVMENFISRILCDSSSLACTDSGEGMIVGSQTESSDSSGGIVESSRIKHDPTTLEEMIAASQQDFKAATSLTYEQSTPILESRRNNLDTIVEAIRHLEGDPSSSIVQRLRLAGSSISVDGSLKILCSSDVSDTTGAGIDLALDSNPILYTIDDQYFLRQEEVAGTPAVAAFEFVSGEQFITTMTEESETKQDVAVK